MTDADLIREYRDQILRLGEAIHQGIRVERERKSHFLSRPALHCSIDFC